MPHSNSPQDVLKVISETEAVEILGQGNGKVPVAQAAPRARRVIIYEQLNRPIRGTEIVNPDIMSPLHYASKWAFDINNGCNQAVTITPIGGSDAGAGSAGAIDADFAVAANTRQAYATELWHLWVGLRATYAVAPTTGVLTIRLAVQEL